MNVVDVSVVIPTINEQNSIAAAVHSAQQAGAREVIVSDGGSIDRTISVATEAGANKIVKSIPGRGIQLNAGAFVADSAWVLFLHADNQLDPKCLRQIVDEDDLVWGAFCQQIQSTRKILRAIQWGNAMRVKIRGMAFGDQAIFVRRDVFKRHGGFAEISLMEDVEWSQRMRKVAWPRLLDGPVMVDPRRWEKNGAIKQTLRNWSIQLRYKFGESPESLRRRYR